MSREATESGVVRTLAEDLASHWGASAPEFIRSFSNIVYRFRCANGPLFLRITPAIHRSRQQILSELSLIRHLSDSAVPVSAPCPDREGRLIRESWADGATYFACAFREAEGTSYRELDRRSDRSFFCNSGRTLAALHNALDSFQPGAEFQRFAWQDDLWHSFAQIVPQREEAAWGLFQETMRWLATLPRTKPAFGLIHGDFTLMNLRILPDRVTAFDFDSSCEHWRAYDLACFLHYFGARPEAERMFAYDSFLTGYSELRVLDPSLIQQLPRFGKMRLLYSFLVFGREWGFDDLTPEQEAYFEVRRRLFSAPPTWPGLRAA
jgi:Ser/Thr protein kinase RdoA (MazF antagonist)